MVEDISRNHVILTPANAANPRFSATRQTQAAPPPIQMASADTLDLGAATPKEEQVWRPALTWDALKAGAATAMTMIGRFFAEMPQAVTSTLTGWRNALARKKTVEPPPLPQFSNSGFGAFTVANSAPSAPLATGRLRREMDQANPFSTPVPFGFTDAPDKIMGRRPRTGVLSGKQVKEVRFLPKPFGVLGGANSLVRGIPVHNLTEPVAVIDIGSSVTKVVVVDPAQLSPVEAKYEINLKRRRGFARSVETLESTMLQIKQLLVDHGVTPENTRIFATAALREHEKGGDVAERLTRLMNQPVRIISPRQEAKYIYQGVLRDMGIAPRQKNLVLEVGGGSTEFAFGVGPRHVEKELTGKGYMPLGSRELALAKPFDPVEVAAAQALVKHALSEYLTPEVIETAGKRPVYLGRSSIYRILDDIEIRRTGHSLIREGLGREKIDWYLGKDGLKHLSDLHREKRYEKYGDSVLKNLVGKLAILRQISEVMNIETFHFGNDGGMKAGVVDNLARRQIAARMQDYGQSLQREYLDQLPEILYQLEGIFPDLARRPGAIKWRAKDAVSIADKLTRKATRTGSAQALIPDLDAARRLIGDGHGLRLVLDKAGRENVEQVRDNLIAAIRDGKIRLLEVRNYHGGGEHARPYFTSADLSPDGEPGDIEMILDAARAQGQVVKVRTGENAVKRSGYTTTQFKIQFQNPRTGGFENGPVAELQVRGEMLDKFCRIEHLLYDIQKGKNVYKDDGTGELRAKLEPIIRPLADTLDELSEPDHKRFQAYLTEMYDYIRRAETGENATYPELPEGLPEQLKVENLADLYQIYDIEAWLHKFRQDVRMGAVDPMAMFI